MVKVKATDMSVISNVKIRELGRVAMPGEEFYVTETRYNILSGNNRYHMVFVTKVEQENVVEENFVEDEEVINNESILFNDNGDIVFEVIEEEVQTPKRRRKKS